MKTLSKTTLWLLAIISLGVFLRLWQYGTGQSFWKDEVGLARNFLKHDLSTIHLPYHDGQAAPTGFVQISKVIELVLGHSEHTFWLWPLLVGCAMLPLAYRLWRKELPTGALLLAVGLLALNATLILHTTQFKPYLGDALCALLVSGAFFAQQRGHKYGFALYLLAGLYSLWVSYTAVFVITGLGLWQLIAAIKNKDQKALMGCVATNGAMAAVWITLWVTNYSQIDSEGFFKSYWNGWFVPVGLKSGVVGWWARMIEHNMSYLMGGMTGGIPTLLLVLGVVRAWGLNRRLLALLAPIAVTFVLAVAQQYPLSERLIMFWVPLITPFIALGVYSIYHALVTHHRQIGWAIFLAAGLPFLYPLSSLVSPRDPQELRQTAMVIAQQAKSGDIIWVHPRAEEMYKYYFKRYPLKQGVALVYGKKDELLNIHNLLAQRYGGQTVWVAITEPNISLTEIDLLQSQAEQSQTLKGAMILNNAGVLKLELGSNKAPSLDELKDDSKNIKHHPWPL